MRLSLLWGWAPCMFAVGFRGLGDPGSVLAYGGEMQASAPRPGDYNTPLPCRREARTRGGQVRHSDQDVGSNPNCVV